MIILDSNKNKITISDSNYIGGGGQGKVYQKGSSAYKIYHNTNNLIPEDKVKELSKISSKNVLAPTESIYDENMKRIGFIMPYVKDTIPVCELFIKGFKDSNNIDSDTITKFCNNLKTCLKEIHKQNCLVGDHNEMNILTDKTYMTPYYIDADSYKTPSFPCTAIMDSVRDRFVPFGAFSEETDWFGWAIVTFQIWTNFHPYKCKNPKYSRQDIHSFKLMDHNVSIFDKDSEIPKNGNELSCIPKNLRDWYKNIFFDKKRNEPPVVQDLPPNTNVTQVTHVKTISGNNKINIKEVLIFNSNIKNVYTFNGKIYTITKDAIYSGDRLISNISSNRSYLLCECDGSIDPIIIKKETGFKFYDTTGKLIYYTDIDKECMVYDGVFYSINGSNLVAHKFKMINNKIFHSMNSCCSVFEPTVRLFTGVAFMDVVGMKIIQLPFKDGRIVERKIIELKDHRILKASRSNNIVVLISESKGKYYHNVVEIDNLKYNFLSEETTVNAIPNCVTLNNHVNVIIIDDDRLDLFRSLSVRLQIDNIPFDSSNTMYSDGSRVLMVNKNQILHISTR